MRRRLPFEREIDPKENLEILSNVFIYIVIGIFILGGLLFLAKLLYNPMVTILSIIGNTIINIINYISPAFSLIIILLMASVLAKLGTFLEDENDILLYEFSIYLSWILDITLLFGLGLAIILGIISMSVSLFAGIEFILFIAPPIVFAILKGICYLSELIAADSCHNPFE
jgi:hypothetical protein